MSLKKWLKRLGFITWLAGLGMTVIHPDVSGFLVWFTGLSIYFIFDIRSQRDQARKVQESL